MILIYSDQNVELQHIYLPANIFFAYEIAQEVLLTFSFNIFLLCFQQSESWIILPH